ncbi:MAG: gliding motility lipoprotein GldH [Bacteroidales bacterium]|nr:gliding motility lipoprotein GldH [Bacteroidales bacterium]MDD3664929.1 gliding motility lipoprotein GldH [Bacteroidales bacterium]
MIHFTSNFVRLVIEFAKQRQLLSAAPLAFEAVNNATLSKSKWHKIRQIRYRLRLQNFFFTSLVIIVLVLVESCQSGKLVDESVEIADEGWKISDSVVFDVSIDDTLQPVDFYFTVRNLTTYPYANLLLFLDTYYPGGGHSRDTLECFLANKAGEWSGSGIGGLKSNRFLVKRNVLFPNRGQYRFAFTQAMRDDPVVGITDIGITFVRNE